MKRIILAALAALFLASPAFAVTMTNEGRHIDEGASAPAVHRGGSHHRRHGSTTRRAPAVKVEKAAPAAQPSVAAAPMGEKVAEEAGKAAALPDVKADGLGMVRVKTAQGFWIRVHPAHASKFLKFFALLKQHGHRVDPAIVGCYSPGHKPGSNHRIGAACDNQRGWNRAPAYMYKVGALIRQAGLYDGCSFGDCGHVEAVRGLYNAKPNIGTAIAKFKAELAAQKMASALPIDNEAAIAPVAPKVEKAAPERRSVRRHHHRRHGHRHYRRYASR